MIVSDIRGNATSTGFELSAQVVIEQDPRELRRFAFRCEHPAAEIPAFGDPFLASLLIPCMMLQEDLTIEGPVSLELVEAVQQRTMPLMLRWRPEFSPVSIEANRAYVPRGLPDSRGTGTCFSGGLDSRYTLEKNLGRITHLVLVEGFDRSLEAKIPWQNALDNGRAAAEELGRSLIVVSTNARTSVLRACGELGRRMGRFPRDFYRRDYHGSLLVAVGLCLHPLLSELLIPASDPWEELVPWGSHPELDTSWNTRILRFEHDGCEASRIEKVKRLAAWRPESLRSLSVCQDIDRPTSKNCSRCEKCLRTLSALRLSGVSHLADSFAEPLDLGRVEQIEIPPGNLPVYEQMRALADEVGDASLASALDAVLDRRFSWRRFLGRARRRGQKLRSRSRRAPTTYA